jgi:putative transposase
MARLSRLVVQDVVHHVVARGVDKGRIFRSGFDKGRYLKRTARIADEENVQVHGYCLMDNHVHFLLTPTTATGLARFFSRLHTWWAMHFNRKYNRTGHLFESRYFSSPLSECHYWTALCYVELNPIRAKLAKSPEDWPWSSARAHLNRVRHSRIRLTPVATRATNDASDWTQALHSAVGAGDEALRKASRSSKPCGSQTFIRDLETKFGRKLAARPEKIHLGRAAAWWPRIVNLIATRPAPSQPACENLETYTEEHKRALSKSQTAEP